MKNTNNYLEDDSKTEKKAEAGISIFNREKNKAIFRNYKKNYI